MNKMRSITARCLAFLMLALCFASCAKSTESTEDPWQEQYDLGVRYLSKENYEEAALTFAAAIEIDPKRAEAYAAAAEAYMALGDADSAMAILQQGYEATNDETLLEQKESIDIANKRWQDKQIETFGFLITMPITGADLEEMGFTYDWYMIPGVEGVGYNMHHPEFGSNVTVLCSLMDEPESEDPKDCGAMPLSGLNIHVFNVLDEKHASAIRLAGDITFNSSMEDVINAYGRPTVETNDEWNGSIITGLHYQIPDYWMIIGFQDGRMCEVDFEFVPPQA